MQRGCLNKIAPSFWLPLLGLNLTTAHCVRSELAQASFPFSSLRSEMECFHKSNRESKTKMQLIKSRRSRVWNPQRVCGMESTRSVECNQSEGEIHAAAGCHTPSAITYSPAVRLHANPSDWIEKRPFENGLFS